MKKTLIIIVLFLLTIFLYGRYIEPHWITNKEINIANSKISEAYDGFKIIHFSDLLFNYNTKKSDLTKLVEKINAYKPDIILFTGDLIDNEYKISAEEQQFLITNLQKLDCNLYKYAIIGDNDEKNLDLYHNILDKADFKLLNNAKEYIFYHDLYPIKLIGITNPAELNNCITDEENIEPIYTILLTHNPNNLKKMELSGIDLILSGHNLGGIINVPFYGPIINKTKDYKNSYYQKQDTKIYISNGIGTEKFTFRLFNRPSFNFYRLEKEAK